jgi:antitoxin HigA-1
LRTLRHSSIEPAHPGALIAEVIASLEISKAEMARQLGITRAALYNVIEERSAVSADLAVRFEAVTRTSADLLVRMQAGHDLWRARCNHAAGGPMSQQRQSTP